MEEEKARMNENSGLQENHNHHANHFLELKSQQRAPWQFDGWQLPTVGSLPPARPKWGAWRQHNRDDRRRCK